MDMGAHTVDLLLWLLGDYVDFTYFDDAVDGLEANSLIEVKMKNGANGRIELSRNRKLRNTMIFYGSKGDLEVSLHTNDICLKLKDTNSVFRGTISTSGNESTNLHALLSLLITDFVTALETDTSPRISAKSAMKSIQFIEECYMNKNLIEYPWE